LQPVSSIKESLFEVFIYPIYFPRFSHYTLLSFFTIILIRRLAGLQTTITMFNIRGKVLTALITLTCSVGFMLFGYDQGVLSGLIGANNQFGTDFDHPDPTTQGLIVSVYQLGNVGGSIAIFLFGDSLGRKKSLLLSSIIMLVGAALQTASVNRGMMYAARIITGFVSSRFTIS
jgi:hypothetical protein